MSLDGKDFDDTNLMDLFDSQDVIVNGRLFLDIPYKGWCEGLFGRWVGGGGGDVVEALDLEHFFSLLSIYQ